MSPLTKLLFAALLLMPAVWIAALEGVIPGVAVREDGGVIADGVTIGLSHYDAKWMCTPQICEYRRTVTAAVGFPRRKPGAWLIQGTYLVPGGLAIEQSLTVTDPHAIAYVVKLASETAVQTNTLCLSIGLPEDDFRGRSIMVDDARIELPEQRAQQPGLWTGRIGKVLRIDTPRGRLIFEGAVEGYVQDNRSFGEKRFEVRLFFEPRAGAIAKAAFATTIRFTTYASEPIAIAAQATTGFRDDKSDGEHNGGWTDQGANDLRMMPVGERSFAGIRFAVVDPQGNGGKSCIVLRGPQRDYFPATAAIPVERRTGDCLYLLHAVAWTPGRAAAIGTLDIGYEDGTSERSEVVFGRDVGDWWNPVPQINGRVAWTADNPAARVGLYVSKFPVANKPIRSVGLASTGKSVWMIVGLSLGEDVPQRRILPSVIVEGERWRPIVQAAEVEAGGILDFSAMLDAPAGKYGRIAVRDGHFEFAERPGARVRFYGANLTHGTNFPSREEAERLAEQIARRGYNVIRLHHYDYLLADPGSPGGTGLLTGQIDRFHYLISCLKKRGIYITIDLHSHRAAIKGAISEVGDTNIPYWVNLAESAMRNWQSFAENVLIRPNPYTGMTLGQDPALIGISIFNENYFFGASGKLYEDAFAAWLGEQGLKPKDETERKRANARFVSELNLRRYTRCRDFLRKLGVQAPLTDSNNQNAIAVGFLRERLDFVDNHTYWDHPKTVEGLGDVRTGASPLRDAGFMLDIAATRVLGKPFVVTEFNAPYPNHHRAELAPYVAALAGLQDWDGLYRFDYADGIGVALAPTTVHAFGIASDPINLLADLCTKLIFLRGDVQPSKVALPYAFSDALFATPHAFREFPKAYSGLGLYGRIGSVRIEAAKPGAIDHVKRPEGAGPAPLVDPAAGPAKPPLLLSDEFTTFEEKDADGCTRIPVDGETVARLTKLGIIDAKLHDRAAKRYIASTQEMTLDAEAGRLSLVTGRAECFSLSDVAGQAAVTMRGASVTAAFTDGPATVAVLSFDGKPIRDSGRLLVLLMTDTQQSHTTYRDDSHTVVLDQGRMPHLVRQGAVDLRIALGGERTYDVWACDLSGKRVAAVVRDGRGAAVQASLRTITPQGQFMVYDVVVRR